MAEAVSQLLAASDHVRRLLDDVCGREGITRAQYNVLTILRDHPDGCPRCEIMRRLIEYAPDVTRLVDRLERRGLAERVKGNGDRRLSITRIRPAGLALLERLEPRMQAVLGELTGRLTERERKQIAAASEKLSRGAFTSGHSGHAQNNLKS